MSNVKIGISPQEREKYADILNRSSGSGGYLNTIQEVFLNHDRYGNKSIPSNIENTGLVFITRPKLNLSSPNIRMDPVLGMLDTTDPSSIQFAIRCILDTKFMRDNIELAIQCPFINYENPFNVPLCNSIKSVTGWPDFVMGMSTTTGGFQGENLAFATGHDEFNKTYDISLQVRELPFSILLNMFYFWFRWMSLMRKNDLIRYPEDIDLERLPYTISIYRFMLDPSNRHITSWSRAAGNILQGVPYGAKFNMNENETYSEAAKEFSISFTSNYIEYNNVNDLIDFNRLVKRYCPDILNYENLGYGAEDNYSGIPYIGLRSNDIGDGYELLFKTRKYSGTGGR